jgi:outer membrane biosynthesis protein TonB
MNLYQYIKGIRRGEEINRLEREAMNDPFLADAMDGFNNVADSNHEYRIKKMRTKVLRKTRSGKKRIIRYAGIAASLLFIIGIGGYFLLNDNRVVEKQADVNVVQKQIVEQETLPETKQPETKSSETKPSKTKPSETKPSKTKPSKTKQPAAKPLLVQTEIDSKKEQDSVSLSSVTKEITFRESIDTNDRKIAVAMEENVVPDDVTIVAFGVQKKENEQNLTVKGRIVDTKGVALSGVAVVVKGSTIGVSSNNDGYYTLHDVPQGSVLEYTLVGYVAQEQTVEKSTVNVILVEETKSLDEITIVAFGVQKKENAIGSVVPVDANSIIIPSKSLKNEIAGRIATDSTKKKSIKPKPVIGKKEYKKYLKANIVMPQSEDCKGKKGGVKLKFFVSATGRPVNIRVKKSLCPEADREAIRLLEYGPDWTYGDREVEIEVKFKLSK